MKRNLVLLSLLLFGFVSTAPAQVTYQITSTPTFVANLSRADVLGSVRIAATNNVASIASSIQIQFTPGSGSGMVACDNTDATLPAGGVAGDPVVLKKNGVFNVATVVIASIVNNPGGCIVTISVPAGILPTANPSADFIELQGVRGRIDLSGVPPGLPSPVSDINGTLNATPANSSLFTAPTVVRVSTVQITYTVSFQTGTQLLCLPPPPTPVPQIKISEGFPGSFVQNVANTATGTAAPADKRKDFFANPLGCGTSTTCSNTRFKFTLTLATGVSLSWPAAVFDSSLALTGASFRRVGGATDTVQIYEFQTPSQGTSDLNTEVFKFIPAVTATPTTPPTPPSSTVLVQINPPLEAADLPTEPTTPFLPSTVHWARYNDPGQTGTILIVSACTTNLLFPFTANVLGFDTGIAIANTTTDPYGTGAQKGTCAINAFPIATTPDSSMVPPPAFVVTTPVVQSGDTFVFVFSAPSTPTFNNAKFNGFEGYLIAICNYQFAHGFAFIQTPGGAAPNAAEGYVALVIPDPLQFGGVRLALSPESLTINHIDSTLTPIFNLFFPGAPTAPVPVPPYGEGLMQ